MKKTILLLLACCLALCCCNRKTQLYEPLNISYKDNLYQSRGMLAAVYHDEIYYFSDEEGRRGIYTMKLDGSDSRILLECEDIQGIQIVKDRLYVSVREEEDYQGKKVFGLYEYGMDGIKKEDMVDHSVKAFPANGFRGLGGFFIDEKGRTFLNLNIYNDKRMIVDKKMIYQENGIKPFVEEAVLIAEEWNTGNKGHFSLFQLEDNYFACSSLIPDPELYDQNTLDYKGILQTYGYNCTSRCWWWNCDEFSNKWKNTFRIWDVTDNRILLTADNVLFAYDLDTLSISNVFEFSQKGKIVYVRLSGETIYVLFESNTPSVYSSHRDESSQILYTVSRDFSSSSTVKDYGTKGKMLYVDDHSLLDYDGESIRLYNIENGMPGEQMASNRIELPVKSFGYQIDLAGEWIFIKYYDRRKNASTLVLKNNYCKDWNSGESGF